MKIRRHIFRVGILVVVAVPILALVIFRMPIGPAIEVDDYAHGGKFEHLFDSDLRARLFEEPLGNQRVYLSRVHEIWVSAEDYQKVYGSPPRHSIRYRVYPVLAGLGRATVLQATDRDDRLTAERLKRLQIERESSANKRVPNQAAQSMTPSVTPPAGQEARQP
jgi:hypothetical protein